MYQGLLEAAAAGKEDDGSDLMAKRIRYQTQYLPSIHLLPSPYLLGWRTWKERHELDWGHDIYCRHHYGPHFRKFPFFLLDENDVGKHDLQSGLQVHFFLAAQLSLCPQNQEKSLKKGSDCEDIQNRISNIVAK